MSSKRKHTAPKGALKPSQLLWVRLLSGLAMVLAMYLIWISFSNREVVGCGPASSCHTVLKSRWAYWFGLPVSLFGFVAYLVLFLGTFRLDPKTPAPQQRQIWNLLLPCSILILGGALWFSAVQALALRTFCPYCLTTHGAALAASVILLFKVPWAQAPEKPWQQEKQIYLPPLLGKKLVLAGGVGLAVFVGGQFLHQPITYLIRHGGGSTGVQTNAQSVRIMKLFDGRVELNLNEVPIKGSPQAPHLILKLHDYTCQHCREMYRPLKAAQQAFSNELSLVSLPMPLDANCNPLVPRGFGGKTKNSCEYAKISLAIWRADPQALDVFENWIFTPNRPPPLPETMAYAKQLVGEQALTNSLQDGWITNLIQKSVSIYDLNIRYNSNSSIPQIFIGTNVVYGTIPSKNLYAELERQFGLRLPATAAAITK